MVKKPGKFTPRLLRILRAPAKRAKIVLFLRAMMGRLVQSVVCAAVALAGVGCREKPSEPPPLEVRVAVIDVAGDETSLHYRLRANGAIYFLALKLHEWGREEATVRRIDHANTTTVGRVAGRHVVLTSATGFSTSSDLGAIALNTEPADALGDVETVLLDRRLLEVLPIPMAQRSLAPWKATLDLVHAYDGSGIALERPRPGLPNEEACGVPGAPCKGSPLNEAGSAAAFCTASACARDVALCTEIACVCGRCTGISVPPPLVGRTLLSGEWTRPAPGRTVRVQVTMGAGQ